MTLDLVGKRKALHFKAVVVKASRSSGLAKANKASSFDAPFEREIRSFAIAIVS